MATFAVDILGSASDRLAIAGALNLTNAKDQITFTGTPNGTSTYVLATYGSVSGIFDVADTLPAGYRLIYGLNELHLAPLTAVPEPATWVAAVLTILAVGWTQRPRWKKTRC